MAHDRQGLQDRDGYRRRDQRDGAIAPRQFVARHHFLRALLVVDPALADDLVPLAELVPSRFAATWSSLMALPPDGDGQLAEIRARALDLCARHGIPTEPATWLHDHILETAAIGRSDWPESLRATFLSLSTDFEPPPNRERTISIDAWNGHEPRKAWEKRAKQQLRAHADEVERRLDADPEWILLSSWRASKFQKLHRERAEGDAEGVHISFLWAASRFLGHEEWIDANDLEADERTIGPAAQRVLEYLELPSAK